MSGKLIVNLKPIRQNILNIKKQIKGSLFCAVVKASCYGMGIGLCKHIDELVDYWAVACITEAKQVAEISNKPILVLSPPDKDEYCQLKSLPTNIECAIDNIEVLRHIIKQKLECKIHIVINTGMNRYGTDYITFIKMLELLKNQHKVKLVGVFSHFYKSTKRVKQKQYNAFKPFIKIAKQYNPSVLCHIANSQGIDYPLDMVRVGIGLYKVHTSQIIQLQSYIKSIRDIGKGEAVSYGAHFVAGKPTRVAVVSLGYADGIMRKQGGGYVLINNAKCKIIGDICMDCFMVDITKCKNTAVGDKVIILGKMHKHSINVCQNAKKCDTISYELLTRLGSRIQRVYKE